MALRFLSSVADDIRKCEQCVDRAVQGDGSRSDSVSLTPSFCLLLINIVCGSAPLVTMSVLCYNKGCGQRFDPENNPDGE